MTGIAWLDSAVIAVSLFNTILLLWLGLTVLLNARERSWGVWLVGGGFLGGAIFFISHTAIYGQQGIFGQGATPNLDGLNFWWRVGWLPVMLSPFAWYVAVLWFCGCWSAPQSALWRRHRARLLGLVLGLALLLVLQLLAAPIPAFDALVQSTPQGMLTLQGGSWLLLLYPLWMIACVLLSLDVLRQPVQLADPAASVAFGRSRPWLVGAAAALLSVTLAVTAMVATIVATGGIEVISVERVALYDLAISLLIALATLLLGQAITAYEIFLGRALPRRSLARHWHSVILLAAGFSVVAGWSVSVHLRPIYALLLATLLLSTFYALYSWRSFRDRERLVAQLRPAAQSQQDAGALGSASIPYLQRQSAVLLAELSADTLGARRALLLPGTRALALGVAPLAYPQEDALPTLVADELPPTIAPLSAESGSPYAWSIPLWDARERIGALLVGARVDGRLFNEEMLESAQAAGERILQQMTGEQMVRRLLQVQQKRTVEQRILDQQTRRTLHDEVLPSLHLAILQLHGASLSASPSDPVQESMRTLAETHQQIAQLLAATQPSLLRSVDPCDLEAGVRGMIEGDFAATFDTVRWETNEARQHGKPLLVDAVIGDVVLGAAREAMRNAATHGRGGDSGRALALTIALGMAPGEGEGVELTIADDGVGLDRAAQSQGGAGAGLALHGTLLALVGGALSVDSPEQGGTRVRIVAPK